MGRARSLSDLLTSALDANLAQISVQQNEDMRKISAWVAIAAVPDDDRRDLRHELREHAGAAAPGGGYPVVLAGMALVCVFLYRRFRQAGWL